MLTSCATVTQPFRAWTWTEAIRYSTTPARARLALFNYKPSLFKGIIYYQPMKFNSARYGFMLSKLMIEAGIDHKLLKVANHAQQISVIAPYGVRKDGRLWIANIWGVFTAVDVEDAKRKLRKAHF